MKSGNLLKNDTSENDYSRGSSYQKGMLVGIRRRARNIMVNKEIIYGERGIRRELTIDHFVETFCPTRDWKNLREKQTVFRLILFNRRNLSHVGFC